MFTGIIEETGQIISIVHSGAVTRVTIQADVIMDDIKMGDSIAVNGVCVTATGLSQHQFYADLSPETVQRTSLAKLKPGSLVNLERATKLGDRLGGHIVSGHVDSTAVLECRLENGNSQVFTFKPPQALMKYLAAKGSVAIDGISLTIANCTTTSFSISIIPFTLKHTTLFTKQAGDIVNIECDILCKYVEKLMQYNHLSEKQTITADYLKKTGFI